MPLCNENLTWAETTPGVWERGVDETERFYTTVAQLFEGSGRMFFAITGHVTLVVQVADANDEAAAGARVDDALRKAWLAIRYYHPSIASQVIPDSKTRELRKVYRTAKSHEARGIWLDDTFVSISTGQMGVDWANSDPPAPKLPTLFVVKVPTTAADDGTLSVRRDLVFRSPHDIIDGIGTLHLLNNLIGHASEAYNQGDLYTPPDLDGSEADNLSPSYRIAACVPPTLTEAQSKRLSQMAAENAAATQVGDDHVRLAIPYKKGPVLPGKHQRTALVLSAESTAQLLEVCREINVTVTHLFHAAIAIVMRDLQPAQERPLRGRYINYILRNERSSCHAPYNGPKHAAAVYHSVSGPSLVVDLDMPLIGKTIDESQEKAEFLRVVEEMRAFYHSVRDDEEHYILACPISAALTPSLPELEPEQGKHYPVPPPKDVPSVSISSMGKMNLIISPSQGAFEAYNPWVTGEELSNGLGLFLGTYRGELWLSGAFNDAWHGNKEVFRFLGRCSDAVSSAFDLDLH